MSAFLHIFGLRTLLFHIFHRLHGNLNYIHILYYHIVCAQLKLFVSFSLYDILMIMCNPLYIPIKVILKQAATWFLIPVSFVTFSIWYTQSADKTVPMVDHTHPFLTLCKGLF